MQCPQCGAENADSAAFCSLCYSKFPTPAELVVHQSHVRPPAKTVVQGDLGDAGELPPMPPSARPEVDVVDPLDRFSGLPDGPGSRLIRQGLDYLEAGMPEEAFSTFGDALAAYQSEGVVSWRATEAITDGMARSYAAQGRYQEAATHYLNLVRSKGLRLGMGSAELAAEWNRVADYLLAGELFDDAEQIYGLSLKVDGAVGDRVHALTKRAECLDATDRAEEALQLRQQAERLAR